MCNAEFYDEIRLNQGKNWIYQLAFACVAMNETHIYRFALHFPQFPFPFSRMLMTPMSVGKRANTKNSYTFSDTNARKFYTHKMENFATI